MLYNRTMLMTPHDRAAGCNLPWRLVHQFKPCVILAICLVAVLCPTLATFAADPVTQPVTPSVTQPAGVVQALPTNKTLVIATKESPPFAMKDDEGHWSGLAIDLWRGIADDLGVKYTFHETSLHDVLAGVTSRKYDAGVAAVTITSEREQTLDFSQPYYVTGLGIAVPNQQQSSWVQLLKQFVSMAFLKAVMGLIVLLLIAGFLVWLFERRRNPEQFAEGPGKGLLAGFWWAAVTMTTVGYGDKAPATVGGRLVGLVWMFTSIIVISGFTAAIASSLTLGQLQGPVQGPGDLGNVRVGAVQDSTSTEYLKSHRVTYTGYTSSAEALAALNQGKLDAVVYDEPILRYQIKQKYHGRLFVLPGVFYQQYYGIALPDNSPLREQLNQSLLNHINGQAWRDEVNRYLGK